MDFLVELFRNLLEHPDWNMTQACTDSYTKTLKKFHGWLASSSFTVESITLTIHTINRISNDIRKTVFNVPCSRNYNQRMDGLWKYED
jgi:hypothetical protein